MEPCEAGRNGASKNLFPSRSLAGEAPRGGGDSGGGERMHNRGTATEQARVSDPAAGLYVKN
ncbi:MAG: hypothetical protein NW224_11995 [Leptolyngbyaceae cyanobacterium bins.302]|nr:hypothetical protein [Leptolyngbyaceae cyanobacterium bins.302]